MCLTHSRKLADAYTAPGVPPSGHILHGALQLATTTCMPNSNFLSQFLFEDSRWVTKVVAQWSTYGQLMGLKNVLAVTIGVQCTVQPQFMDVTSQTTSQHGPAQYPPLTAVSEARKCVPLWAIC